MAGQAKIARLGVCLLVAASWGFALAARADLLVAGYQDRLHDPFYVGADKAFIGAAYNWSGYGRWVDPTPLDANWKQVTMISDNYFLTANHNRPNLGDDPAGARPKVRFYRTTDPNGEYWEAEIAVENGAYQGQQIGTTDLWVGKLASTPPDWVTRYPLAKRHLGTNYLSYTDKKIFIFGQDSPRSLSSVRVGLNEVNLATSYGSYQWDYDPVKGLGIDEAQTQSGDSGGPTFFSLGRTAVFAGVHTQVNIDTGVANSLQEIAAAIREPISTATPLPGDLNGDFRVDVGDLTKITATYGKLSGARYSEGDLSGDGKVDFVDFVQLIRSYGQSSFAPADFDRNGLVDGSDLAKIGAHWQKPVEVPYTWGDANGDSFVDIQDLLVFDTNQFRGFFGPLPAPLATIPGDLTGDGLVDAYDWYLVSQNLDKQVTPGTLGDADGNGVVDIRDQDYVNARLGSSFGDITGDHVVGIDDFLVLVGNWNKYVAGGRTKGDLNGDDFVNGIDARILFDWWGHKNGTFAGMMAPEPATACLMLLAVLVGMPIRRRSVGAVGQSQRMATGG